MTMSLRWFDKLTMSLITVGFIFITGCASSGPSFLSHALNDDLQEAQQLIREGHNKQAVDELTIFLEMSPKNSEGRFLRGLAYQNLEQFSLAIQDYEKLIGQNPNSLNAHYNLGMIYAYKTGETVKALKHFDQYLSLYEPGNGSSSQSAYEVAKIMCRLENSQGKDTPDSNSLPSKIIEASQIDSPDEKKKFLTHLAEQYPTSPLPDYLLGKAEVASGQHDEAQKYFEKALNINLTCGPCHEALGDLLIQKKKIQEGQIHKKKAQLFMGTINKETL